MFGRHRPRSGGTPRPRRHIRPALLAPLRVLFRHSASRDAYVLRLIGDRFGPVLKPMQQQRRQLR
jgi:hypothetical protein